MIGASVRTALAAVALALAGGTTGAEPAVVRSGEHPGFSRLVIDLGTAPDWTLSADGRALGIAFAGPRREIDVSGVFDRMGRGRVRSVAAEPGRLDIDLACDCPARVYALPGGRLVVDVADAGSKSAREATATARPRVLGETVAEEDPAAASPVMSEGPRDLADPAKEPGEPSRPDDYRGDGPARRSPPSLAAAALPGALPRARPSPMPDEQRETGGPTARDPRVARALTFGAFDHRQTSDAAATAVGEALERAASQGLIEVPEETAARGSRADDAAAVPRRRATDDLPLPLGTEPALRVTTSLDRSLRELEQRLADSTGSDCLFGYDLDVAAWGSERAPAVETARLRGRLVGEFDAPDIKAARALARYLIYLSFGAEAKAVLAAFPLPNDEAAVLQFLAGIADGETRPPDDAASALLGCPGPVSMWAMLSIGMPPAEADIARAEVASAFSDLPLHLRRHYGPALVERFLDLGDRDTARTIWAALDRAEGDHGEAFALATAALALTEGNTAAAEAALSSLEGASPATAPRAVLMLLEGQLERGGDVDPGLVETAAAMSFENRGTGLARELKIAELRGRIALDAWDEVFAEVPRARFAGALTPEDAQAILSELYVALAERSGDAAYLARAIDADRRLGTALPADPARRALADRFLDLRLSGPALSLLGGLAEPAPEDRLRQARADLLAGRYAGAEEALAGMDGAEAARLRGEALLALGRHREASAAFETAGAVDLARDAAARSGTWDAGPEDMRLAAAAVVGGDEGRERPETPLARNRALVDEADMLRDGIARLLEATGGG